MKIIFTYRYADRSHIFTTRDIPGLLVSDSDLTTAYGMVPGAPEMTVDEFVSFVECGPRVLAATGIVFEIFPELTAFE